MQDFFQFQGVEENLSYLVYSLGRLDTVLDLLLVTITFFLVLLLIRRSQAAVVLRGAILLTLLLLVIIALLQLPTFTWLLRGALLVGLVAIPMIFQPELRRGLESLGRTIGFLNVRPTQVIHRVVSELVRATGNMASQNIGALILLEGETSLAEIIETGVPLNADLTADLLETIFFDRTPLHDGAVVIRDDHVEAAGCVLPLSDQTLPGGMRKGTRHRAALGISERTDCLAIIVSEETGRVSVAQDGRLQLNLESTELRDRVYRFFDPSEGQAGGEGATNHRRLFAWRFTNTGMRRRRQTTAIPPRARLGQALTFVATLGLAFLLAVAAWLLVADQVNPPQTETIANLNLRLNNIPPGLVVANQDQVPTTVNVQVQAPEDLLDTLQPASFKAFVDLENRDDEVYHLPVQVRPGDNRIRVRSIEPSSVDVELQPVASRPISVEVSILDRESLPFSYAISGTVFTQPAEVIVSGPAEEVAKLARAEATIALRGRKSTVVEEHPVVLEDMNGRPVGGLTVSPEAVEVTVPIRQAFNTKDAAVHAVITGTVPNGYLLTSVNVEPNTVTLLGDREVLDQVGGFVDTVPIDVSGAVGEIVRRVPLAPPAGVSALNERGVTEGSVEVRVTLTPLSGNLRLTVPMDVVGVQEDTTVSVSPPSVDVLLRGPLPILDQVNADQRLVRAIVDATGLAPGTHQITPRLIVPEGLEATVLPDVVEVGVVRLTPTPSPQAVPDAGSG